MAKVKYGIVGVVAAIVLLAGPALAGGSAKFHSATSSVNSSGALAVNWDQRGLGNDNITYTLTADATALYACINGGGKHPQAANKEAFDGSVSASGTFEPRNGRIVASLTSGPLLAPSFSCPSGQTRVLASVSYTDIVLTDTTNGVSTTVPDVSRAFFAV